MFRTAPSLATRLVVTDEVREKFLIRPDCPHVLSADRYVWPSIFVAEGNAPLLSAMAGKVVAVPTDNRFFGAFDLWDNAWRMGHAVKDLSYPACGVAFGLTNPSRYEVGFVGDTWFDAIHEGIGVSPSRPGADWPFLGFDVVNSGLTSALSGFGPLDDIESVRAELGVSTNRHCLLSDQGLSTRFCQTANRRYASDGPFFSMAIFLLWDHSGELSGDPQHLKNADV